MLGRSHTRPSPGSESFQRIVGSGHSRTNLSLLGWRSAAWRKESLTNDRYLRVVNNLTHWMK